MAADVIFHIIEGFINQITRVQSYEKNKFIIIQANSISCNGVPYRNAKRSPACTNA